MVIKKNRSDRTHGDTNRSTRDAQLADKVEGIISTLTLDRQAEAISSRHINVRYGTLLSPLAGALAETVDRCPGVFPRESLTGDMLRAEEARFTELSEAQVRVTSLLDLINANLRASAGRLVFHVDGALSCITGTLQNPYTSAEVRATLETSAQKPMSMLTSRREAIAGASRSTKSKNAEANTARAAAEKTAEENRRLVEENRYLRGEEDYSSLSLSAPPAAARTARRTRKTPR